VKFIKTPLHGVMLIELEPMADERGDFARTFCREDFLTHGLNPDVAQCSISRNVRALTLRGMHYQERPYGEDKLVRCPRGSIYDVVLDIRPDSPSALKWFGVELSSANRRMLYIPEGLAHGFLTLEDDTEVAYQMSRPFSPGSARGIRWNDPLFSVEWPRQPLLMSSRDRAYPDFEP